MALLIKVKAAITVLKIYEYVIPFVEMVSKQHEKHVKTVQQMSLVVEYAEMAKRNLMKHAPLVLKITEHVNELVAEVRYHEVFYVEMES